MKDDSELRVLAVDFASRLSTCHTTSVEVVRSAQTIYDFLTAKTPSSGEPNAIGDEL